MPKISHILRHFGRTTIIKTKRLRGEKRAIAKDTAPTQLLHYGHRDGCMANENFVAGQKIRLIRKVIKYKGSGK